MRCRLRRALAVMTEVPASASAIESAAHAKDYKVGWLSEVPVEDFAPYTEGATGIKTRNKIAAGATSRERASSKRSRGVPILFLTVTPVHHHSLILASGELSEASERLCLWPGVASTSEFAPMLDAVHRRSPDSSRM